MNNEKKAWPISQIAYRTHHVDNLIDVFPYALSWFTSPGWLLQAKSISNGMFVKIDSQQCGTWAEFPQLAGHMTYKAHLTTCLRYAVHQLTQKQFLHYQLHKKQHTGKSTNCMAWIITITAIFLLLHTTLNNPTYQLFIIHAHNLKFSKSILNFSIMQNVRDESAYCWERTGKPNW